MTLILSPSSEAGLPEGMIHRRGTPCPFEGLGYPKGDTCCSFDATGVQEACLKRCGLTLAPFTKRGLGNEEAEAVGQVLLESVVNRMVFHSAYEKKAFNRGNPLAREYEEARARGEDYPDWTFDRFAAELIPVGQAGEWLIQIGKAYHGVRFNGRPSKGR